MMKYPSIWRRTPIYNNEFQEVNMPSLLDITSMLSEKVVGRKKLELSMTMHSFFQEL